MNDCRIWVSIILRKNLNLARLAIQERVNSVLRSEENSLPDPIKAILVPDGIFYRCAHAHESVIHCHIVNLDIGHLRVHW